MSHVNVGNPTIPPRAQGEAKTPRLSDVFIPLCRMCFAAAPVLSIVVALVWREPPVSHRVVMAAFGVVFWLIAEAWLFMAMADDLRREMQGRSREDSIFISISIGAGIVLMLFGFVFMFAIS